MNQDDKKRVAALLETLQGLKGQIESVGAELRTLADDEQAKYDNLNEGLQASEKGQAIEAAAAALDEAASAAEDGGCSEAIEAIEGMNS